MDFIRLDTTVTLTPTEHRTCVSISIRDDSTVEDTMEDFTVSLTGPQDTAVLLSRSTATISIIDNDGAYTCICTIHVRHTLLTTI